MQPGGVFDVVEEVWQICRDVIEGLVLGHIDSLDLQRLHEAFGLLVIIRIPSMAHGPDEAVALEDAPVPGRGILGTPVDAVAAFSAAAVRRMSMLRPSP